ncbi:hypothetical protein LAUMK136_05101 [Mycobacterium attenuatum]|uniref:Uncharacterized protein n=1 Tax=Mycobacterium attenuatum TaxID=2341086 RepID=A0A498QEQ4_9MYCO|nr:hypothetical protein LAUMK136_05101 [Mycobacterium attenuatum]
MTNSTWFAWFTADPNLQITQRVGIVHVVGYVCDLSSEITFVDRSESVKMKDLRGHMLHWPTDAARRAKPIMAVCGYCNHLG